MPRDPSTPDCKIKGCKRADDGCGLCVKHHKIVPMLAGIECALECASASRQVARRHHRKWVRYVQQEILNGRAS